MMKKFLSAVVALIVLLSFASCTKNDGRDENGEYHEIIAAYSIKSDEENFIVEVQNLGGVYTELYDDEGLFINLAKNAKILDKDGNEIKREDLSIGATLKISYDGELAKKNPKTIKAYEIEVVE